MTTTRLLYRQIASLLVGVLLMGIGTPVLANDSTTTPKPEVRNLVIPPPAPTRTTPIRINAQIGDCDKAPTGKENQASHVYFTLKDGRLVWERFKGYPILEQQVRVLKRKVGAFGEKEKFYKTQLGRADRTITTLQKSNTTLQGENRELRGQNQKLVIQVADLKAQRSRSFTIGLVVGIGGAVLLGVGTAILVISLK